MVVLTNLSLFRHYLSCKDKYNGTTILVPAKPVLMKSCPYVKGNYRLPIIEPGIMGFIQKLIGALEYKDFYGYVSKDNDDKILDYIPEKTALISNNYIDIDDVLYHKPYVQINYKILDKNLFREVPYSYRFEMDSIEKYDELIEIIAEHVKKEKDNS